MKKNVLLLFLLSAFFSCSLLDMGGQAKVYLNLSFGSRSFTVEDIELFTLTVSGPGMETVEKTTTSDTISVEVPIGLDRLFEVDVLLKNGDTYTGSSTTKIDETTNTVDITINRLLSSLNSITAFYFEGYSNLEAQIDDSTITVKLPYGASLESLTPIATVSDGATYTPESVTDFSSSVQITVTAEDGSENIYTVNVTHEENSSTEITEFYFSGYEEYKGTISGTKISVVLPYNTSFESLTPVITASYGATYTPKTAQDFSTSQKITVIAEDGTEQEYTITVDDELYSGAEITGFYFSGYEDYSGSISGSTINIILPYGTSFESLTPVITASYGATYTPTGVMNFSSTQKITVYAEDNTEEEYTIIVDDEPNTASEITGFYFDGFGDYIGIISGLNISVILPYGTSFESLTPVITTSFGATYTPASAQDFSSSKTITVTAEDGESFDTYTITVDDELNTSTEITSFYFSGYPGYSGTISGKTISVTLPYGTPITSLTPVITASYGATYTPITAQDFSSSKTILVTAEDEEYSDSYTVSVTYAANHQSEIETFYLREDLEGEYVDYEGTISGNEITVTLPYNHSFKELTAVFTVSDNATYTALDQTDFSSTAYCTVTSEDESSITEYSIFVDDEYNTENEISDISITDVEVLDYVTSGNNITIYVPYGTSLLNLAPVFTISDNASVEGHNLGDTYDFSSSIDFVVFAENGDPNPYQVTITTIDALNIEIIDNVTNEVSYSYSDSSIELSTNGEFTLNAIIPDGYTADSYQWIVGSEYLEETSSSITLLHGDYFPGEYSLTCLISIEGTYYSTPITFTVLEDVQ